jgi:hypothetical protein
MCFWRLFVMLVLIVQLLGCDRFRNRKGLVTGDVTKPNMPSNLSRELAQQPVVAPQPPLPPAEPPVAVPKPDALASGIPEMPMNRPVNGVMPPDQPILQTGAIAMPEPDDKKGPIRDKIDDIKKRREERKEARDDKKPDDAKPDTSRPGATEATAAKKAIDAAIKRYSDVSDFEAKLIKREVVGGKQLPQDEIIYNFRKTPLSVSMKVLSPEGQGREVMFVKGQFGDKMHVLTGKGDNILVGVGYKTEVDPDSKTATAKSRYRVYEAGFGRTLTGLTKAMNTTDGTQTVKSLGLVQRKEIAYAVEGVEVTIQAGVDPLLPKGGKRQVYFDPKPDSPGYLLPILVTTQDADGKEVEYYFFDQLKIPSSLKDSDWNPANLGKKK